MDALWERADWMAPAEVRAALDRTVAPTTVGTVLTRLHEKGRVERRPGGKGFQYRATVSREQHVAARMQEALDGSQDRSLALLEFVDRLPARDRSWLARMLRR